MQVTPLHHAYLVIISFGLFIIIRSTYGISESTISRLTRRTKGLSFSNRGLSTRRCSSSSSSSKRRCFPKRRKNNPSTGGQDDPPPQRRDNGKLRTRLNTSTGLPTSSPPVNLDLPLLQQPIIVPPALTLVPATPTPPVAGGDGGQPSSTPPPFPPPPPATPTPDGGSDGGGQSTIVPPPPPAFTFVPPPPAFTLTPPPATPTPTPGSQQGELSNPLPPPDTYGGRPSTPGSPTSNLTLPALGQNAARDLPLPATLPELGKSSRVPVIAAPKGNSAVIKECHWVYQLSFLGISLWAGF